MNAQALLTTAQHPDENIASHTPCGATVMPHTPGATVMPHTPCGATVVPQGV